MSTTFMQTTIAPMAVIFSRQPRQEVIMVYDARRRRVESPTQATEQSIVSLWIRVAVKVVVEDVGAWLMKRGSHGQ